MTATVAALFVNANGIYSGRDDVDAWDLTRDARKYTGGLPVVAHPPCQLWGNFAQLNFRRWGGEHNRPGNDGGGFASALRYVRANGGVLEHPAQTRAWPYHGIPRPYGIGWKQCLGGGWICEVWQSAYGHLARKRTWLYYVGANPPAEMRWKCQAGTHQCGWFDRAKPTLSKRAASATPPEFAEALIALARNCGGSPCLKG